MVNAGGIGKTGGTGASVLGVPLTNVPGGTIAASTGRFDFGPLVNGGVISPTAIDSTAFSNVFGPFTQTSTGELDLKLGPMANATVAVACNASDRLVIANPSGAPATATLDGTLNVVSLGCTPTVNFTVMTFGSHVGTFPAAQTNLPPGYTARYGSTDLTIVHTP
jgi:hypothetical protein